jgi:hypothetical protein
MDLDALATVSDRIYLADIHPGFAKLEGEVANPQDRAWVIVTQATEEDHRRRADLTARREASYTLDEEGRLRSAAEAVTENVYTRIMFEAWATLKDAGNLERKGKPVFAALPAKSIKLSEFEKVWGGLLPVVAEAIHAAVRSMNPDWDWERGKVTQSA